MKLDYEKSGAFAFDFIIYFWGRHVVIEAYLHFGISIKFSIFLLNVAYSRIKKSLIRKAIFQFLTQKLVFAKKHTIQGIAFSKIS